MKKKQYAILILMAFGVLLLTVSDSIFAANPFAYWRQTESSFTATDEVGPENNNGVYTNSPTFCKQGAIIGDVGNGAVHFNGVDQYVIAPINTSNIKHFGSAMEEFTVEFWYKTTATNPVKAILGTINKGHKTAMQIDTNGNWFELLCRSETGRTMRVFIGSNFSRKMRDGKFHHIVWVVKSASRGIAKVYLDGKEDPEVVIKGSAVGGFADFEHGLVIGATNDRGTRIRQNIFATIDEVALYTQALNVRRVKAHYNSGIREDSNGYAREVMSDEPFAYWRLSDSLQQKIYLLLDSRIVEKVDNAVLRIGQVVKNKANPLFTEKYPWEVMYNNLYPNVIYDAKEKLYKVWYSMFIVDAAYAKTTPKQRTSGTYIQYVTMTSREDGEGYAISKDGIHWKKPMMDIIRWKGKKSNLVSRGLHGVGIFKDLRERDPARKYKMVARGPDTMLIQFSPDGIHWGPYEVKCPEMESPGDTHNNVLWVPELNKYVAFTRLRDKKGQRLVARTESQSDFVHWTKAVEVLRGDPFFQTYSMPVFRYAGVYIGLPAIFDIKQDRVWTGLAWSPDTIKWYRIDEGTPLIPNSDKKGAYDWGTVYASVPILKKDEIRIYYGGGDGPHTDWRRGYLCLATLRPDGFAGYEPLNAAKPAVVVTNPITLGSRLRITADAEGGSITVNVLDQAGKVKLTSQPITRNITDERVSWLNGGDLRKGLIGKKLRLRFVIEDAKLYSFLQ